MTINMVSLIPYYVFILTSVIFFFSFPCNLLFTFPTKLQSYFVMMYHVYLWPLIMLQWSSTHVILYCSTRNEKDFLAFILFSRNFHLPLSERTVQISCIDSVYCVKEIVLHLVLSPITFRQPEYINLCICNIIYFSS